MMIRNYGLYDDKHIDIMNDSSNQEWIIHMLNLILKTIFNWHFPFS